MNSLKELKSLRILNLMILFLIVLAPCAAFGQQIEKLELVLSPPTVNTDRHDGYQFELRGNLYPRNTVFTCGQQPEALRLGRYLLKVRQGKIDGLIATWVITLNDGRSIVWDAFTKYELDQDGQPLSFVYNAVILRSGQKVLTDFTPQSADCFGGKLVIYFL